VRYGLISRSRLFVMVTLKSQAADLFEAMRAGYVTLPMAKRPTEQEQQTNADRRRKLNRLSARERKVMLLIVEGLSNREIARRLNMSESTVKAHLRSIYRKLAINNRTTLAVLVAQQRD
jgi:RNA polymerase sigma factor (sigma-70 family)